jgi:hypothetical protein
VRPRIYRSPLRDPCSAAFAAIVPRGAEEGNAAVVSTCDCDAKSSSCASSPTFVNEHWFRFMHAAVVDLLSVTKHCMCLVLSFVI